MKVATLGTGAPRQYDLSCQRGIDLAFTMWFRTSEPGFGLTFEPRFQSVDPRTAMGRGTSKQAPKFLPVVRRVRCPDEGPDPVDLTMK